ncbi:glutathione S-transferase family protein [Ferrovibrio sp.]|uniref:glutathione S-transferase family protein n=1 Tax=Ferrovibrio sp. TaxID=1917215 RepID=UPI003D2D0CBF
MITFYAYGAPNPHKVSIALFELGLPHQIEVVEIWKGAGESPEFLALNPNGKVPVIVDHDTGLTISESNAILLYLAEKTGKLLPHDRKQRQRALELLFFQASGVGPMFGQRAWFTLFAPEPVPYAITRYRNEAERLTGVIEKLLPDDKPWFLGDEYSIVDIAFMGWIWTAVQMHFPIDGYPKLKRWFDRTLARPAVQKGLITPNPLPNFAPPAVAA